MQLTGDPHALLGHWCRASSSRVRSAISERACTASRLSVRSRPAVPQAMGISTQKAGPTVLSDSGWWYDGSKSRAVVISSAAVEARPMRAVLRSVWTASQ
jgi:hypothetical protein